MAEIRVNSTGAVKLFDNDDSHFVGLQAGSVSSNVTFTLPTADGSDGQVLTTDGSGALSFATASSANPPSADGDSLGTASLEWSDLYLADGGIIYFGNDQDVTLTHVADTGVLLNGANVIQFRDSGLTIGSNADGDLDIVSDGTAVDSINIESAGGITLDAGTAGSGIIYEDDGTEMARIHNSSSDVIIESKVSDKDIVIKGNDGGSVVTALTIDMSAGGDLLQGTSCKISSNSAVANFTNHNGSASETTLASSDGNEKVRCFNSGVVTFESGGTEGMRLNGNDVTVSNSNNFTNNGTGGGSGIRLSDVGGTRGEIGIEKTGTSAAGMIYFYNGNGTVGAVVTEDSSTSYATSSDYRLKENAVAISDGITRLKTLKPYRFNFKADKDKTVDGFFAHEVTAVPEAIIGKKDAMAVETTYTADDVETQGDSPSKNVGDPKTYSSTKIDTQGIDQSKLVPLLTSALQEAITKIETLETKVTALEG